jgi:type VI secretion system (T6SS) baseplate-like injector VgrG
MERLLNVIKQHAGGLDQGGGQPRFGVVTSVNPTAATARVTLQPEGLLSGWLPVLSPWTGAGWGMCCPPSPGDQVLVLAQEGDAEHGMIVGRAFSNTQATPATPVGELWLVHGSGSFRSRLAARRAPSTCTSAMWMPRAARPRSFHFR